MAFRRLDCPRRTAGHHRDAVGQRRAQLRQALAGPDAGRKGRVAGPATALDQRGARVEIHLVHDDAGGDAVGLGHDEQAVDELGQRRGVGGGGDDENLIHVGRDWPGAAALRHPALEQGAAGLQPDDGVEPAPFVGIETDAVAHHDLVLVPLGLAGQHRPHLPARGGYPVDRAVPLQHGAEQLGHHSDGARAIASSSAAFTS
jgi:hypothetical protein